jgi:hypothetical protein
MTKIQEFNGLIIYLIFRSASRLEDKNKSNTLFADYINLSKNMSSVRLCYQKALAPTMSS